jgi:carbon-monoxide dehydrogenase large subunit
MPGSILGNVVRRVEDPALLRGHATYVDNIHIEGVLSLVFVRSPVPHARITGIDTSEALEVPGVQAVYTAAELDLSAFNTFGALNPKCARPPLATDRVRFVGEAVAAVVAENPVAAADAATLVDVDYDPLPAVTDPEQALEPDAPKQFDELESNVAAGERDDGTDPLAGADVVVSARLENQRLAVVPMESNAIAVVPGGPDEDYDVTVYVSTQMPHVFAAAMSKVLGIDRERARVIAPHVGGAFGGKAGMASEHAVTVAAARRLARPVKWIETRSENLVSMPHGRGQVQFARLGLRLDGTIVGLRAQIIGDAGAYGGFGGGLAMGPSYMMAQGVYHIPKIGFDALGVLTNTTPMGAFRGAGRPEAAALLERVMDIAAVELGLDPVEIRRRNLVRPDEFPYTTVVGTTYDSGDYELPLREVLRLAHYEGLRVEQQRRIDDGERLLLGIGLSCYVEITGGGAANEWGAVEVHDDGTATIRVGTSAHGQGHATSFAMIVSDRLGIPVESIKFVQSDTAQVPRGGGTGGSRSLQLGGNAAGKAAGEVLDRARKVAAELMEAAEDDIVVDHDGGGLAVSGVPGTVLSWSRIAEASSDPLAAEVDFDQGGATFPFGAHLSVVEVDIDTGRVRPVAHYAVDDCGNIVNPMLVAGQQHGGMAQGIAQALWEGYEYDEDGNPATASLAEYTIPSAADLIGLDAANTETPSPRNPLGAKGIGESATVGATPAVQNAVVDAVRHLGVRHIDMPCTPRRVWQAIRAASAGRPQSYWREPPEAFAKLKVRGSSERPEAADVDI